MSGLNNGVATRLSPFTIPKDIGLQLNALWNYVFVFQKPWEYDYPTLKRRVELIRDANQRGIMVWSSLARVTDHIKHHMLVYLGSIPPAREFGRDTDQWNHITIETYSRLVERAEYQALALRDMQMPQPPQGFPLEKEHFEEICSLNRETVKIWRQTQAMLSSWMFRMEEGTGLTKAGDVETAFEEEDQRRHQRAWSPEDTEISIQTYISGMSVDANQYDPPPPLKARYLPFRLDTILDYHPSPSSVATSMRVGPKYATPGDVECRLAIARWRASISREEVEDREEDPGSDAETIRGLSRPATPRAPYAASIVSDRSDATTHLAYASDEEELIFISVSERAYAHMEREHQRGLEEGEIGEGEIGDGELERGELEEGEMAED
ncbi:hypothetical protein I204_05631 [Kwoniella mangroviensis CBS 8886]|nr:hypothetical protein I204_05631 [Kwoniella mangroviensis CBS 8886]